MLTFLKNTRIKNKIIIIIFSVGALSAITGSAINYYYQVQQTKEQLIQNNFLVSKMLSEYCGLPLEFGYPDNATDALAKLRSIPSVTDGILFNNNGKIFASYHKSEDTIRNIPKDLLTNNTFISNNLIHSLHPVIYKGKMYGNLYIRSYIDWKGVLIGHLMVALSINAILLIIIYLLAVLLHKSISEPIVNLTSKMNLVAQDKDYSIVFENRGTDEIGELYRGFKTMIFEINKKENDLKSANEILKLSKEKINHLLEKTPYPIAVAEIDGTISFINDRFVQVFGYKSEDIPTVTDWWNLAYPDPVYREKSILNWTNATNKARENKQDLAPYEYEIRCKNNEIKIIEISGTLLNDGLLATFVDLTEKKKTEIALIESEERYSKAFLTAPYAITITDPESNKIIDVNHEFCRISGYSREDVIDLNVEKLKLWQNLDDRKEFISLLLSQSYITQREYNLKKKSGELITGIVSGSIIKINNKPFLLTSVLDITDRKETEKALQLSEKKYRTIFENVQDVFFQTDLEGIVTEISPSIKNFSGFTQHDVVNFPLHNLYLDPNERTKLYKSLLLNTEVRDYELMMIDREGEILHVSINAKIIFDDKGNPSHIDGAIRDISEKKTKDKIKEELKIVNSRLTLATKSACIGIWEWDIHTNEIVWSDEMHALFGLGNDETPNDWRDCIFPDDLDDLNEKISTSITSKKEIITDFRAQWPNGEIHFLHVIGNLYSSENESIKMIGVCWDISERKIFEEKLLLSEANLYATINNTTFYIWSIDRNYQLLNLNKPFKHFLKDEYQVDAYSGIEIKEYEKEVIEFSPNWSANYIRALAGESFELTEERKGRHFKYSLNPLIENAAITGVTIFMEETTELKEKEKALLKANEKIGELKIAALRSAMNPHFIFNTLNSIQYFILKNDALNAVNYLSTFSKLIRSILNNSVNNKIKLSEEIDQIKNYVQLELLRFENKFDFNLIIDEELDIENIEVASMLIQPYIENAILHGLYSKTEKGTLKISVEEDNNSILFSIEDNGIGREASAKHNFQRAMSHKSLGTHLTEERLNLLKNQNGATVIIEDLYSEGYATGTRVKIWIN